MGHLRASLTEATASKSRDCGCCKVECTDVHSPPCGFHEAVGVPATVRPEALLSLNCRRSELLRGMRRLTLRRCRGLEAEILRVVRVGTAAPACRNAPGGRNSGRSASARVRFYCRNRCRLGVGRQPCLRSEPSRLAVPIRTPTPDGGRGPSAADRPGPSHRPRRGREWADPERRARGARGPPPARLRCARRRSGPDRAR